MQQAWYAPIGLPSTAPSRPELADPEDEEGMLRTVRYVEGVIDKVVASGVPEKRIILGGFSQGHAITLLTAVLSNYGEKLAGLVALSGYLPIVDRIDELRAEVGLGQKVSGNVPIFIVRGKADIAIPRRYMTMQIDKLKELGYTDDNLELHEYEGLRHTTSGQELRDICVWLEKVVPPVD